MTRSEFINFLVAMDIPFTETVDTEKGLDQVWVYSKPEYEANKKVGKEKQVYVPYLRVSDFSEGKNHWYTRENGLTGYRKIETIIVKCLKLKEGKL